MSVETRSGCRVCDALPIGWTPDQPKHDSSQNRRMLSTCTSGAPGSRQRGVWPAVITSGGTSRHHDSWTLRFGSRRYETRFRCKTPGSSLRQRRLFWRLASGVWRLASGVWRRASGVGRRAVGRRASGCRAVGLSGCRAVGLSGCRAVG